MPDPIYALIADEKRLRAIYFALFEAERDESESSPLFAEAKVAEKAWYDALDRLRNAKSKTLPGVLERLDCLIETGEFDFETAVGVLEGIAERQPDIAVA
jgi:hypothetical protein